MPRDNRARTNQLVARERRAFALERNEFRYPSEKRTAAAGATSFPLKAEDPEVRRLIDEALARRRRG